ncbi:MAG: hypothetical protein DRP80_07390, partial [Candidatus Omnitrophota bacterium]
LYLVTISSSPLKKLAFLLFEYFIKLNKLIKIIFQLTEKSKGTWLHLKPLSFFDDELFKREKSAF